MKIPIFCSLLPTELLIALGHDVHFVTAEELALHSPKEYHCAFHENLCSYSKALYEYFIKHHFDVVIIPSSCDAMKKLYNSLRVKISNVHLLNVPQNKDAHAAEYFAGELEKMVDSVSLRGAPPKAVRRGNPLNTLDCFGLRPRNDTHCAKIAILGANVPLKVLQTCLDKFGFQPVYLNHCLMKSYSDEKLMKLAESGDIKKYAEEFLRSRTCPRMNDLSYKEALKKRIIDENFAGVIVNTIKFCDFHPFDYKYFSKELDIPVLLVEHELMANYEGQIMTRLEAFLESLKCVSLRGRRPKQSPEYWGGLPRPFGARNDVQCGYFIGIDSGSHATKVVCIGRDKKILCKEVVPTGTSVKKSVEIALKNLEIKLGIKKNDIACVVGTGYGRNNIEHADDIITEISCHAKGAHHILQRAATVIDIGGQDSKAILIDATGRVVKFAMNDKCAAGTGRFLEVMADKLEMPLEEFAELAFNAGGAVPISSMCSVFAESEVISLIAGGASKEAIAKGIHKSIAERTISLAKRIESKPPYFMAGGVAKNKGLVRELENCLGEKITVIDEPQFTGALGAALFALERK